MNYRASQVTRFSLDVARTLLSSESVTIFGIIYSNAANNPAEIDIHDGNDTKKITIVVPANDSRIVDFEWIADKGLKIPSMGRSDVVVTIFHSGVGS